jgi:hypothetical protein
MGNLLAVLKEWDKIDREERKKTPPDDTDEDEDEGEDPHPRPEETFKLV